MKTLSNWWNSHYMLGDSLKWGAYEANYTNADIWLGMTVIMFSGICLVMIVSLMALGTDEGRETFRLCSLGLIASPLAPIIFAVTMLSIVAAIPYGIYNAWRGE